MNRQELFALIDKYNPIWSNKLKNYLVGRIKQLPYDDVNPDTEDIHYIDINDLSHCVVGEIHGWDSAYHYDMVGKCDICDEIGNELCEYSQDNATKFKSELIKLYKHLSLAHKYETRLVSK